MTKAKVYWCQLMEELELPQKQWSPFWLDLEKRYREKHRYYHRLKHIGHFIDVLHQLCLPDAPRRDQLLAAFFHDVVYDPRKHDNEERSAQMAGHFLREVGLERRYSGAVHCLIMATAGHDIDKAVAAAQKLEGVKLSRRAIAQFLDSDLAILGAAREPYDTYCHNIAREYSHVQPAQFAAGRASFLRSFMAGKSKRLFHSSAGYRLYESAARTNLSRELARLESKS
jgi:predicted metal-dependent HD superfamily phosphohydrolase